MKNILFVSFIALFLSGCAIHNVVPSFWDDNQSAKIIDTQLAVERLDCSKPHAEQVLRIKDTLDWFEFYSIAKGSRQNDVRELIAPMRKTVDDFYKRSVENPGSAGYCKGKKRIMQRQAKTAAEGVLWRY